MGIIVLPFLLVPFALVIVAMVAGKLFCLAVTALEKILLVAIAVMQLCGRLLGEISTACKKPLRLLSRERERIAAAEHAMEHLFIGHGQCKIARMGNQALLVVDENDLELARKYGNLVGRQYGVTISVNSDRHVEINAGGFLVRN